MIPEVGHNEAGLKIRIDEESTSLPVKFNESSICAVSEV